MRVNIKTTGTTLTPPLKEFIEEKLVASLNKFLHDDQTPILDIELELTTKHHQKGDVWRAEANLTLGRKLLRAEQRGEDPYEVINILKEEITREVRRFREKKKTRERKGGRLLKKIIRKLK